MKNYIVGTIVLLGAVTFLSGCGTEENNDLAQLQDIVSSDTESLSTPSRPAEINGTIASMEGNQLVVKNEVGREVLSDEEREARKADRASMTQEEKQAARAQEMEAVEVDDVSVVVPVGAMMIKGTGTGDGGSMKAIFDDLKEGAYISVWMDGDNVEAIKIKGL
ncbi:MAG: hypothetical protein ACKUBY_03035 [Candidatus Moraniibacteriota bacterium]|jgi:hypothetical protein